MPIFLRPISRRRFLTRSLAAAAVLGIAPELLAARKKTDPQSWALLSDIHIAADPNFKAREINMTQHLGKTLGQVLELPQRPAGLIVTGDLAYNSGQTDDYAQLEKLLIPVRQQGIPMHLGLGNHDNRQRFAEAFPANRPGKKSPGGRCISVVRGKFVNWIVLDSLEQTLSTPGLLGADQLQWLARTLDANPKQPAIVLVHHNPGLEGGNMGLKDTVALMDILRPRQQVKAYIYGHTHSWGVERDPSGLHLVNLPAVAYVFKKGDPSGWVHARVDPDGMEMQLCTVGTDAQPSRPVARLQWRA